MPRLGSENLQQHNAGHFGFTATRIEDLGAQDFTLVTIVADRSGSTSPFYKEMESVLKEVVGACLKSPRADNLMIRLLTFDDNTTEVHGFKLLTSINADDYNGALVPGGATSLYDAAVDGIEATNKYGRELLENDFGVNGIVIVITDGCDNRSTCGVHQVKQALEAAVTGENLESLVSILIAVNSAGVGDVLKNFHADAGFTQYVELANADKNTLAKLAQFVSKSISSQSQHLGSGGPSASLTF